MAAAVDSLVNGVVRRIVLTRPAVEAGVTDRSGLSESDLLKFDHLLSNVLNQLEMTGSLVQSGLMTEEEIQPVDWWLRDKLFCYPGAREWLEEFELFYPPAYFNRLKRAAAAAIERQ